MDEPATGDTSDAVTKQRGITNAQAIVGTLQYMAPEQLQGKTPDTRTDIFAFGAVLYEMIGDRKAFHGDSQAELIAAILEHEPARLFEEMESSVPGLDRLVSKCLRKDPDARWQTSADLLDELRWIVGERRMAGTGVAPQQRSSRHALGAGPRPRQATVLSTL